MNKENLYEAMGNINEKRIHAAHAPTTKKKPAWVKWGAMAACLALVVAIGTPFISNLLNPRGGQDFDVDSIELIEYNGCYYEPLKMSDKDTLKEYNLPNKITEDMIGDDLGTGKMGNGNQSGHIFVYEPYADATAVAPNGEQRHQRAVYVYSTEDKYTFALLTNPVRFDNNTAIEATEMFVFYGIDAADDIASITISKEKITDSERIAEIFTEITAATAFGADDYRSLIYDGKSEEEQQTLSKEHATEALEIQIETTSGIVLNRMNYYPSNGFLVWASLFYYQIDNTTVLGN